jgi:hypothetical protein
MIFGKDSIRFALSVAEVLQRRIAPPKSEIPVDGGFHEKAAASKRFGRDARRACGCRRSRHAASPQGAAGGAGGLPSPGPAAMSAGSLAALSPTAIRPSPTSATPVLALFRVAFLQRRSTALIPGATTWAAVSLAAAPSAATGSLSARPSCSALKAKSGICA